MGRDLRRFSIGFHPAQVAGAGLASARIGLTRMRPPQGLNENGRLTAAVSLGAVTFIVAASGQVFCMASLGTTLQAISK
jgi:hypothetical protein